MAEPDEDALRHVLYTGPGLAGVTTSVAFLGAKPKHPRLGFVTTMRDGTHVEVYSDVRTNIAFEDTADPLAHCSAHDASDQLRWLRPHVEAHARYLEIVDAVVFVADSQPERSEANREILDRLRRDLRHAGRAEEADVAVVFQCNKRDLPNLMSMEEMRRELSWSACEHVPACARTGDGVRETLDAAVYACAVRSGRAPPYR
jgi:mutual gliding-motility protein MglA